MKKWLIGGILIASFLTGCLMWHNIDKWFNKDIEFFYAGDDDKNSCQLATGVISSGMAPGVAGRKL